MDTPKTIVAECIKRGMTQIEISRYSGLGRSYISLLVSGARGNGNATELTMNVLRATLKHAKRKPRAKAAKL
jgi:transcriptional regulator with XRE-family HTH domain